MRFILGLLLGFALGFALGLLLAPQPNHETREAWQQRFRPRREEAEEEA